MSKTRQNKNMNCRKLYETSDSASLSPHSLPPPSSTTTKLQEEKRDGEKIL